MEKKKREDYIESREEAIENIQTLYSYLNGEKGDSYTDWAVDKIKLGKNYVVEVIDSEICFCPSRFVGYKNNTKIKHERYSSQYLNSGTSTDQHLSTLYKKVTDERLDDLLHELLAEFDESNGSKKYWIPKDTTVDEILSQVGKVQRNYWIARISNDHYWEKAIEEKCWLTQQRYGIQNQGAVTQIMSLISEVKEGDILLLTYSNEIHAYGKVVKCNIDTKQMSNISDVVDNKEHDYDSGMVKFDDSEVFYEDLTQGCNNWGQRINVDGWHYYEDETSVYTDGLSNEIVKGSSQMSLIGITEDFAKDKVDELKSQYNRNNMEINKITKLLEQKRNIILQGAPGTGKTYNTAVIALSILEQSDVDLNDHAAVMKRYAELQDKQIFFTTFHQSLDYEDFVEGLKPSIKKDNEGKPIGVTYDVEDGIFKMACNECKSDIISFVDKYITKINGFDNRKEIPTKSGRSSIAIWHENKSVGISLRSLNSDSDKPENKPNTQVNINDLKTSLTTNSYDNHCDSNRAYAEAMAEDIKKEFEALPNSVVLIIDEINRGNISKIFGELITLLESDKRAKGTHSISVTLPYSKQSFSVPDKLYIIGTMNTTDRSTGTLDYALRRRFAFVTLKADREVMSKYYDGITTNDDVGDKALALFDDIHNFIESENHLCGDMSIDDLMVGHSYFMAANEEELKNKMEYEVVPLINEYINDGILNVNREEKEKAFGAWLNLSSIKVDDE